MKEFKTWNELMNFLRDKDISILDVVKYDIVHEPTWHIEVEFNEKVKEKI